MRICPTPYMPALVLTTIIANVLALVLVTLKFKAICRAKTCPKRC